MVPPSYSTSHATCLVIGSIDLQLTMAGNMNATTSKNNNDPCNFLISFIPVPFKKI